MGNDKEKYLCKQKRLHYLHRAGHIFHNGIFLSSFLERKNAQKLMSGSYLLHMVMVRTKQVSIAMLSTIIRTEEIKQVK